MACRCVASVAALMSLVLCSAAINLSASSSRLKLPYRAIQICQRACLAHFRSEEGPGQLALPAELGRRPAEPAAGAHFGGGATRNNGIAARDSIERHRKSNLLIGRAQIARCNCQ